MKFIDKAYDNSKNSTKYSPSSQIIPVFEDTVHEERHLKIPHHVTKF